MLFGELLSVISHRGDVNLGHFVSYHRIDSRCFLNDDSRRCQEVADPMLQRVNQETAEVMFFKSRFV